MSHPAPVTGWRRGLYLSLAAVFFGLGAVGAMLPGLPTTPFLLLTSFFLIRSSPRLNRRLMQSRFFGSILRDWHEHRGVRTHVKVKTVVLILLVMVVSLYFGPQNGWMKLGLVAVVSIGLVVVVRLPTVPSGPSGSPSPLAPSSTPGGHAPAGPTAMIPAARARNGEAFAAAGSKPSACNLSPDTGGRRDVETDL